MQSHGKKGTRPLDILLGCRGEGSHEADSFKEIDLQNNVEWVDSRAKESLRSYQKYVTEKYKDDTGKRPLYDQDSWIQAVGGKKKGRLYGFNHISDPHAVMTGTPSISGTSSYLPARNEERSYQKYVTEKYKDDTGKRPLYDQDSWIQAVGGKKKGRLYGFNHISDPHAVMTGTPSISGTSSYLPARNEEVQQLNEKIIQLQQEKEAERLEKEKEKAEKFTMMEKIEENRVANAEMKEQNAEMKKQIGFLLKNISKSFSN